MVLIGFAILLIFYVRMAGYSGSGGMNTYCDVYCYFKELLWLTKISPSGSCGC